MADLQITIIQPLPTVQTVVAPSERTTTEVAATQGPAGPSGASSAPYAASQAVSGHQVLALTGPGQAGIASCDVLSDALAVVGVSQNAAVLGGTVRVCGMGEVEHSGWSWSPGPVFLGLNGSLTQVLPPGALFSLVVGVAVSSTLVLVNLQPPVFIT